MTPERLARIIQALERRQPDLTVVMEHVAKPHNLAAIARTAEAVGILDVHAITRSKSIKLTQTPASGIKKWVKVRTHQETTSCIDRLKSQGHQIVATHLNTQSVDFRDVDYTRPTAILVGTEKDGISDTALAAADVCVRIPMMGLVESFNVSVATALILYQAFEQRDKAGLYDVCRLDNDTFMKLLFEWCHPQVYKYCQRKNLPMPKIDNLARILEPLADSVTHTNETLKEWWRRKNL